MGVSAQEFPSSQTTVPASKLAAITPADADLANWTRAIYVGGAGDLAVLTVDDTTITFVAVPAGSWLPVVAKQIKAATTATSIVSMA